MSDKMTRHDRLRQSIAEEIDSKHRTGLKWMKSLEEDMFYALRWSSRALTDAATVNVLSRILKNMNDGDATTQILDDLERSMLHKARWPERSTSAISNLMHQEELAAITEAVIMLRDHIEDVEKKGP